MTNRLVKLSTATYTPGVIAKPGRAAYCITTERLVQETLQVSPPVYGYVTITNPDPLFGSVSNTLQYTVKPGTYRSVSRTETTTVCFPEIPGVAGDDGFVAVDQLIGWNAGANSIATQAGDLLASFQFVTPVSGALGGLASGMTTDFNSVEHGLYATNGQISVYESGRQVFTAQATPEQNPALAIVRRGREVTYQIGSERYVSREPSVGSKTLVGLLYAAGDSLDVPVLAPVLGLVSEGGTDMRGRAAVTGGTAGAAPGMTSSERLAVKGAAFLFDASRAGGAAPIVEVSGFQGFTPFGMSATGSTIYLDSSQSQIPLRMRATESGQHAAGRGQMDFVSQGYETPELLAYNMIEPLSVTASYSAPLVLLSVLYERLTVGSTLELLLSIDQTLFDGLVLDERFDVAVLLEQILRERLQVSDDSRAARQLALQYAANLASGGVARYQDFDFKGFARIGLDSYGYRSDGVYLLDGATDDGRLRQALVEFGVEDFGTTQLKRADSIYLGLTTDGEAVARILVDGQKDYTYRIQGRAPTVRALLGRGLNSKLWQLRLEITEASEIDLDSVEWLIGSSVRKLTR